MSTWTIPRRIALGFASLLAIAILLGSLSLWRVSDMGKSIGVIADNTVPSLVALGGIQQANTAATRSVRRSIIEAAEDPQSWQKHEKAFEAAVKRGDELREAYGKLTFDDRERQLFIRAVACRSELLEVCRDALALVHDKKLDEARTILRDRIDPQGQECIGLFDEAVQHNVGIAQAQAASARRQERASFVVIGWALAAALGLASLLGAALVRSTGRALSRVSESLENGAVQTAAAAGELSSVSESLAAGCSEQGSSVAQTSAALEQMATMIKSTADNAARAKELANQARSAAEAGAGTMTDMTAAMTAIEASSAEVAKIVKNIDEIAFQTNILALNAAVEAARAGEAGQGFAVVADEVRSLAQRSAAAARETAEKIEAAIANSRHGSASCGRVGASLVEIAAKVTAADSLVAEIATAAREQTQGIKQIGMAMTQMDGVTRGNAARAEESSSAAAELNSQAQILRENVEFLRSLVAGGSRAAADQGKTQERKLPRFSGPAPSRPGLASAGRAAAPAPRLPRPASVRIPMPGDVAEHGDDEDRNFTAF